MKRFLLASTLLAGLGSAPANANLVLFDNPTQPNSGDAVSQSFIDLGAQGFGNAPAMLTLHNKDIETGGVAPTGVAGGTAIVGSGDAETNGNNKAAAPTLASLGWTAGNKVFVGFNSSDTGNSGITLQSLALTVYNTANAGVATFSIAAPIQFTALDLGLQQGHGSGIFGFVLDGLQQTSFNNISGLNGNFRVGLAASLGCAGTPSSTCQPSDGGQDSFVAIAAGVPVPGPIVGAGIPGVIAGCFTLLGLARSRRRRNAVA